MSDVVEIRRLPDGSIDEIVARDCTVHIEQMTADSWYVGIYGSDDSYWQLAIGSKGGRAHVVVRHVETSGPEGPGDDPGPARPPSAPEPGFVYAVKGEVEALARENGRLRASLDLWIADADRRRAALEAGE